MAIGAARSLFVSAILFVIITEQRFDEHHALSSVSVAVVIEYNQLGLEIFEANDSSAACPLRNVLGKLLRKLLRHQLSVGKFLMVFEAASLFHLLSSFRFFSDESLLLLTVLD